MKIQIPFVTVKVISLFQWFCHSQSTVSNISFETAFRDCTDTRDKFYFHNVKKKKNCPVDHPKQAIDLEKYGWGGQSKGHKIWVSYRVGGINIKIRDLENCTSWKRPGFTMAINLFLFSKYGSKLLFLKKEKKKRIKCKYSKGYVVGSKGNSNTVQCLEQWLYNIKKEISP